MAYREVHVIEIREVLRGWLSGVGLRVVAAQAGVDRKTARRYVSATQEAGLTRGSEFEHVTDEIVGAVVASVRPARPAGHGSNWGAGSIVRSHPPASGTITNTSSESVTWTMPNQGRLHLLCGYAQGERIMERRYL